MITNQQEYLIKNSYPVPESPLDLLIRKEESDAFSEIAARTNLDAETLIFLADFAARWPDKWETVKEKVNDPRSTYEELARRLNINRSTVMRHLKDLRAAGREWLKNPEAKKELVKKVIARYEDVDRENLNGDDVSA